MWMISLWSAKRSGLFRYDRLLGGEASETHDREGIRNWIRATSLNGQHPASQNLLVFCIIVSAPTVDFSRSPALPGNDPYWRQGDAWSRRKGAIADRVAVVAVGRMAMVQ